MSQLESGKSLLPAARDKIVTSLATMIMVHTERPSSKEMKKVLQKLVSNFPVIADKVPGGSPYVNITSFCDNLPYF